MLNVFLMLAFNVPSFVALPAKANTVLGTAGTDSMLDAQALPGSTAKSPPHIVMMMVDDLGFAAVGFNSPNGEPRTPHIDSLAREGAVLNRHYTFKYCGPSRSSFLSGRLPLHVNQQNSAEWKRASIGKYKFSRLVSRLHHFIGKYLHIGI